MSLYPHERHRDPRSLLAEISELQRKLAEIRETIQPGSGPTDDPVELAQWAVARIGTLTDRCNELAKAAEASPAAA